MSTIKRMLSLSVAVVVASLAFGASSALAADSATCAFTGLTGSLTPAIPAAANDPGGINSIETGDYTFNGDATCVVVEGDVGDPPTNSGVYAVTIDSAGQYENQVCGTGWARGTDPNQTTVTGGPPGEGPVNTTYEIRFVGGAGTLDITGGFTPQHDSVDGAGYVQIVPSQGNCVNEDVSEFTVAGAFTAVAQ